MHSYRRLNTKIATKVWQLCWWVLLACPATYSHADNLSPAKVTSYQYRTPGTSADHRFDYEMELLKLALTKTVAEFGPYELTPAASINLPRAMALANGEDNLIFKTSYTESLTKNFYYPPYPIDRGIFSYRVCFENKAAAQHTSALTQLSQLQQLTIGQGVGWLDNDILTHNGFTVIEATTYENLFPMLAGGRFDLFCRGISEVQSEWDNFGQIGGFAINQTFALYYPLPRFFWIHKSKPEAYARINRGLQLAYTDGSALKLWQRHYQDAMKATDLSSRRIFILRNPYLNNINPQYKPYFLGRKELKNH